MTTREQWEAIQQVALEILGEPSILYEARGFAYYIAFVVPRRMRGEIAACWIYEALKGPLCEEGLSCEDVEISVRLNFGPRQLAVLHVGWFFRFGMWATDGGPSRMRHAVQRKQEMEQHRGMDARLKQWEEARAAYDAARPPAKPQTVVTSPNRPPMMIEKLQAKLLAKR